MFVTLYNTKYWREFCGFEKLGKCVVMLDIYDFSECFDKKNKNLPNNRIYDVDRGGNGATGVSAN
jgi:hypothetical protein